MDHSHREEGRFFALPTPTDTPYRTPPRSRSRQSGRHGSASPDISSSPVPFPINGDVSPKPGQDAIHSATDENISPLDPRRFTPSLHASLVSEILSLRREVESKTKDIEGLEASLDTTRNEKESLQETVLSSSKETRSLKRQMQLLEGGTASAVTDLSKERDEALDDSVDLRKRLDLLQKKVRGHEETAERTQVLWDRDRGTWETEKRALETKVHIVESRMKVLINEIANTHVVNGEILHQDVDRHDSSKKMHTRKGSAASIRSIGLVGRRRDSELSSGTQESDSHGYRLSTMTLANGHSTSLADELAFDEEEEDQMGDNVGQEEQTSSDELPEERPMSAQSRSMDLKARKILGLSPDDQLSNHTEKAQHGQSLHTTMRSDALSRTLNLKQVQYVDVAVQYSPPASPILSSTSDSQITIEVDGKSSSFCDAVFHRDPETTPELHDKGDDPFTPLKTSSTLTSTSCQPSGQLHSPPSTPLSPVILTRGTPSASPSYETQMISASTQTITTNEGGASDAHSISANSFQKHPIPIIAIHPPASRPTTPIGNVVLPPHTKNASCQTDSPLTVECTSSSTQTEETCVDTRTAQLPQGLPPPKKNNQATDSTLFRKSSALQPANPLPNSSKRRLQQPGPNKPATSQRRVLDSTAEIALQSPTFQVEETVTSTQTETVPRNSESSASIVADEYRRNGYSSESDRKRFDEEDIFSRPTAKFTLKAGKLVSKTEPEINYQDVFDQIDAEAKEPKSSCVDNLITEMPNKLSRRGLQDDPLPIRPLERKARTLRSNSSKQFDIRRAALISSGAAAHQSFNDRSSSAPIIPPPFPVPTRHSSRKIPISTSEGAQSPTPTGRSPRKRDGKGRKPLLRKVRSATSVSRRSSPGHRRSPSPPSVSSRYGTPDDPDLALPPMPFDDIIPAPGLDTATSFRKGGPVRQESYSRTDSASTVVQQTSVVDAIAQTMVGEWMYKYVRRRKSFGVSESKNQDWDLVKNGDELSANITNTGVRHKRWVWLAPYERAVMWSSKQPTSGSALMGKSGRKLEIQSVLDVKDDNPLPKGSGPGPHVNRSILILTPQRALKFTATSQERHYVWLTALSFLSHSPLGLGDLTALPNIPQQEYLAPIPPGGSLRRNPIRDSIRVAKGRDPRGGRVGQRAFTTDGVIPQHRGDTESSYQPREPIYQPIFDAADPPTVPRYSSNSRHRSNTGPRIPPPSFRNFSNHTSAPAVQTPHPSTYSITTATTTSDIYPASLYNNHHHLSNGALNGTKTSFSRRGSEASASVANSHGMSKLNSNSTGPYFDHHHRNVAPTMRMEAFITEEGEKRPRGSYRTRQGRKKDMGYWGVGDRPMASPTMTVPGVELPDEVVGRRSSSRPPALQNGGGNSYPGVQMMHLDSVSVRSDDGFRERKKKRLVLRDELTASFERRGDEGGVASANANQFRGF